MEEHEIYMNRALELAKLGEKTVAPNPMVGCVVVRDHKIVAEGYHLAPGQPHAEIHALQQAGDAAKNATFYVTLEPCSHHGRTPPCADALIDAGIGRLVVAMRDPDPRVNGSGIQRLREAGIPVTEYVMEKEARELNRRYLTRMEKHRPWIVAKWAMTLDGKIASRTGSSHWVSSESTRRSVHALRGQMDAILVGSRTARRDDPMLTVRTFEKQDQAEPDCSHAPLRIVLDSSASLSLESRLVKTARDVPVLVGVDVDALPEKIDALKNAGCEVLVLPGRIRHKELQPEEFRRCRDFRAGSQELRADFRAQDTEDEHARREHEHGRVYRERFRCLFAELAGRGMTNLLVEGGGIVLGSLFDARMIDEVHVFVAPKLIGGAKAVVPLGGIGWAEMSDALRLESPVCRCLDPDIYVHGRVKYAMD